MAFLAADPRQDRKAIAWARPRRCATSNLLQRASRLLAQVVAPASWFEMASDTDAVYCNNGGSVLSISSGGATAEAVLAPLSDIAWPEILPVLRVRRDRTPPRIPMTGTNSMTGPVRCVGEARGSESAEPQCGALEGSPCNCHTAFSMRQCHVVRSPARHS
jgi:hypothetical protein